MRDNVEQIGKKITEVLGNFQDIEIAYLFGSFIAGDLFNDIDVALYVSAPLSAYEGMKFSLKVSRELERAIRPTYELDVKLLNQAPLHFQYEVIKTGKRIFSRDEVKRIRYEAELISSYLDYKDTSDWLDREFLRRI